MAADPAPVPPDPEAPATPRIALLEADPELTLHLSEGQIARARAAVTAPLVVLPEGQFDPGECLEAGTNAFGALVISGLVFRELSVGGQPTLCLLGPGDVIRGGVVEAGLLTAEQSWTASMPTRIALLDDHFLHAVRHWPRLLTALVDRALETHDGTLVQLAISQQPRVEDRLVALFAALADRWGRVTGEGVVIPVSLTHEALGRLIGARRPTVTLALKALGDDARLRRRRDGSWVLTDQIVLRDQPFEPLSAAARPHLVGEPHLAEVTAAATATAGRGETLRGIGDSLRLRMTELAVQTESVRRRSLELVAQSSSRRAASAVSGRRAPVTSARSRR